MVRSARGDLKKVRQSYLRDTFSEILATLKTNPFEESQSFEKLTPPAAGKYSRRLNGQHRVVYKVDKAKQVVTILSLSAWPHYK